MWVRSAQYVKRKMAQGKEKKGMGLSLKPNSSQIFATSGRDDLKRVIDEAVRTWNY
jgi:hypothetical protein